MDDVFQSNWSTSSLHLLDVFQSSLPRTVLSLLSHTLKTPTHLSQVSAQFHLYHETSPVASTILSVSSVSWELASLSPCL